MKPKIIIDTLSLLGNLSGIGRYTYEIAKILPHNSQYRWRFFYGYVSQKLITHENAKTEKYIRNLFTKNAFTKKVIRKLLCAFSGTFSTCSDLYWQPNFIPTQSIKARKIIATVHDFSWELYPEFHPKERITYFQENFYMQIARCDHIITGSHFTKNEIIHRTNVKPENITVIYHGINHRLFKPHLKNITIQQKYILAVGSIEPRKNLKNLLLAYSQCEKVFKDEYHLYLVGDSGWKNDEIMKLVESMNQWVHSTGYISDTKLADMYRSASVFVYPSFYEGFGIPPLEAMACGIAVIASNTSTLPEVCRDAAYYVNPLDSRAIMEGIKKVLSDEVLRQELISKGLKHAQKFSWEKSAKEHMVLFEKVLKQ